MDNSAKLRSAPDNKTSLEKFKSIAALPRPLRASDRMSDGEGVSEAFRSAHKRSLRYKHRSRQRRINALQHCTSRAPRTSNPSEKVDVTV
jgi:hypothetical protein